MPCSRKSTLFYANSRFYQKYLLPLHQQIPPASRKISVPSGTFLFMGVRYTHQAFIGLPPVWKTLEVISMGTLSKLYANFSDSAAKHAVAREFGLKHHKFLRSWLECLAVLRNCCAHHSRLSNRVFPVKPMMPERMPNTWITDFSFREQTLYPQLCYVVYWLNSIFTDNTFVTDFKQLLARHQSVNPHLLGFPYNWEQEPLWK